MVIAVTWERCTQPDVVTHEKRRLDEQPPPAVGRQEWNVPALEWAQPTTEEEDRDQEADQNHVRVFGQEEQCKRRTGIFNHVTCNDFRLTFNNVEWRTVRFCNARNHVDKEQRQQRNQEPIEQTIIARLSFDNFGQVQATCSDHHADHRKAHRDFVGNDLCRCTHRTEERILGVRCIARKNDAVNAKTGHRKQIQQAGVRVRYGNLRVKRNDRPRTERRHQY